MARRWKLLAATGVAASMLALLPGTAAWGAQAPPWIGQNGAWARALLVRPSSSLPGPAASPGSRCQTSLNRAAVQDGAPRMAIVGASFTAGVGPDQPQLAWSVLLARQMHWDAMINGVPGAGYIRTGTRHKGPMSAELRRAGLAALAPRLVIVQAGHDDIGLPVAEEKQHVRQTIGLIRAQAPQARIALLTVFPGERHAAEAAQTDRAIVTAARAADPHVLIMDPLTGHWVFPRSRDGLHPTAAGDAWIAAEVASLLQGAGVQPGPAGGGQVCDNAVTAPPHPPQPSPPHPARRL